MNPFKAYRGCILIIAVALLATALTAACSSGGSGMTRSHMHYGAGYHGYYHRPWGYSPVYGHGAVDPDWDADAPAAVAQPMPDMGMPDFDAGGMDMDF
jgi:hypothetical protein